MVGGSEGVGNLVGEPGGLKGGADLVLGFESLNQVLIVVVNLSEQGGAFVTSKDVRGVVLARTLTLEAVGAAHALKVEDFFLAGEILAARQKLGQSFAGGLVEKLMSANDFAGELGVLGNSKGGIHN